MRLLSILPIARGIRKETLTYFSAEDIPLGTLVSIPLRKKTVQGVVIGSVSAVEAKAEIKGMSFSVKKIVRHKNDAGLPAFLIEAAKDIAEHAATSVGAVLSALVPKICLENPDLFFKATPAQKHTGYELLAIQADNVDRFDAYKSVIRESFAKKKTIAVIAGTEAAARIASEALSKGIADYTLTLPETTSKKTLSAWQKQAHDEKHPMLLVGTSSLLALLPSSTGTIILEEESSPFYKMRRLPYLDARKAVKEVARALGARVLMGDKLLSVETLARIRDGKIHEYSRIGKRSAHKIQTLVVDMREKEGEKKDFHVLMPDLLEMIRYSVKSGKTLFIYCVRRGLSPQTICRDCSTTVLCDECESPVVLHGKENDRKFICHHCGKSRSALEQCRQCGSWNLVPYGIGIELVEDEIKKATDADVVRIDSDNTANAKEAKAKIEKFLDREKAKEKKMPTILLGTELALRYLPDLSVDFAAIPSIESLRSLPDFRTSERVMHALLDVKAKAKECMLIQSRDPKSSVIEQGLSGDLETFAKDEIKARKAFGYPPYMHLLKLTVAGKKDRVKEDAQVVSDRLKEYSPRIFPAFIKSIKGQTLLHILVKIPEEKWPDKELSEILMSLPPSVKIDTSPQSLL
ncbi:MAG: hypothetical protein WC761_05690 [Candidatus Paceibacterota bacterium]|jgi:primosomal protein N'